MQEKNILVFLLMFLGFIDNFFVEWQIIITYSVWTMFFSHNYTSRNTTIFSKKNKYRQIYETLKITKHANEKLLKTPGSLTIVSRVVLQYCATMFYHSCIMIFIRFYEYIKDLWKPSLYAFLFVCIPRRFLCCKNPSGK